MSLRDEIEKIKKEACCQKENQTSSPGNSGVSNTEQDTLKSVTYRGNSTDKELLLGAVAQAPLGFDVRYNMRFGGAIPSNITTGQYNVSYGPLSLQYNKTGSLNTAIGTKAMLSADASDGNVAVGERAGESATLIRDSVIMGGYSANKSKQLNYETTLGNKTLGSYQAELQYTSQRGINRVYSKANTAVGSYSMSNFLLGTGNTSIGYLAGNNLARTADKGSDYNIFLGYRAASNTINVWGDNNVFIGANAPANASGNGRLVIHSQSDIRELDGGSVHGNTPLIGGNFIDRWFSVGGKILLNTTYTPNSQGDPTFTKTLTAKPDGTIGWEDKNVPTGDWVNLNPLPSATADIARYKIKGDTVQLELHTLRVNNIGRSAFALLPAGLIPAGLTGGMYVHGYNATKAAPVIMRLDRYDNSLSITTNTDTDSLIFTVQWKIF